MNKYLVTIYVPMLEAKYDCLIPNSKRIIDIVYYCSKAINNLTDGVFELKNYSLVNRDNGTVYDSDAVISKTDIANGSELIIV